MADNKFAAVLILSVIGLVLVIGVALKTCASPRRANAKIYRQSRKVLVAANGAVKVVWTIQLLPIFMLSPITNLVP
jgi:hypothetical protein